MQRVLVLDVNRQPLMPCHPARARELLDKGKAAVFRHYPFTIILKERIGGDVQPVTLKIDPGSRVSGIALVAEFKRGKVLIWAADLHHRGQQITNKMSSRSALRRGRRSRKLRYRPPRFNNRRRPEGWLPPSLQSRVDNIVTWIYRLGRFCPITSLAQELVRFDTQKMQNPEISGVEYQQGMLFGYEVREYLLEKWGRVCVYCGCVDVPLEVEHIVPKRRGGSDRVSNLTLSCRECNVEKGDQTAEEYGYPDIQARAKQPLKNAAAINTTRWALYNALAEVGLPIEVGTGGRTKFNRVSQGYPKAHWIDAACIGESGEQVAISLDHTPLHIKAAGRGSRQMCSMDRYGFPRTRPKQFKRVYDFLTGDIVRAVVPSGKNTGAHLGRVAVRASGSFRVGQVDGISWKYCQLIQCVDGYEYKRGDGAPSPCLKTGASAPQIW